MEIHGSMRQRSGTEKLQSLLVLLWCCPVSQYQDIIEYPVLEGTHQDH